MYDKNSPETVQKMFSSIASQYDFANGVMSFGLHKVWNEKLVNAVSDKKQLLDLCSGTGEIAFSFLKKDQKRSAILLDFCAEMLEVAQKKGTSFENRFKTIVADAQKVPLPDQSVDAITIAYGIRNVKNPKVCFQEAHRLLQKDGKFAILELTRPTNIILQKGHSAYLKIFLPLLGKCISRNKEAYQYLSQSIKSFASPDIVKKDLLESGFHSIETTPLIGGVATLITALK